MQWAGKWSRRRNPAGPISACKIRSILLDPANQKLCPIAEMLLYFAARAQNFDERILPAWERGAVVLSDRFTDSTLAYQGGGRGLGPDVVMQLHDIACHGLQPDLTICIDIDTEAGLERTRTRNGSKAGSHGRTGGRVSPQVRQIYLDLGREYPERIKIIDGEGTRKDVAERIWRIVEASCLTTFTAMPPRSRHWRR